jgi:hypothetical protein
MFLVRGHEARTFSHTLRTLLAGLVCAAAAAPAAATAQDCQAPPGMSGIDQYCESVPDARGQRGAGEPGGRGQRDAEERGGNGARVVSKRTARALRERGHQGEAVLAFVRSGGSTRSDRLKGGDQSSAGSGGGEGVAPRENSSDPLSAITSAVDSGSTTGPGLVWLLVATALAFVVLAWLRYRRRTPNG